MRFYIDGCISDFCGIEWKLRGIQIYHKIVIFVDFFMVEDSL